MGWGVPYLLPWALNDTRKSPFQGKEQKKSAMGRSVPKRWAQVDFSADFESMRVFNKECGLNVQVVLPVQVKHVTAVLQDNVQGIGGLLLVGVRDHSERQPGSW